MCKDMYEIKGLEANTLVTNFQHITPFFNHKAAFNWVSVSYSSPLRNSGKKTWYNNFSSRLPLLFIGFYTPQPINIVPAFQQLTFTHLKALTVLHLVTKMWWHFKCLKVDFYPTVYLWHFHIEHKSGSTRWENISKHFHAWQRWRRWCVNKSKVQLKGTWNILLENPLELKNTE